MITNLYSARDNKAGTFSPPFTSTNDQTAIRIFTGAVSTPGSMLYDFAADYDLVCVGQWDDCNGELIPKNKPDFIVSGSAVKRVADSDNSVKE